MKETLMKFVMLFNKLSIEELKSLKSFIKNLVDKKKRNKEFIQVMNKVRKERLKRKNG